jgi:predicted adenylyl cyclase CyaB
MVPPSRNLELKAHDPRPAQSLAACRLLGAEDKGLLLQQDTYFNVPEGRLKLRRESDVARLIAYERDDLSEARQSLYRIAEVTDATGTEAALAAVLGIQIEVSKQRRLFVLGDIRIHLDLVVDLGSFIEFEAVAGQKDPATFEAELTRLRQSFEIDGDDLIAESYADLKLRGI